MIFADAFSWLAFVNPNDAAHQVVRQYSSTSYGRVLTTEWVLAEACDGLASQRTRHLVTVLRELWRDDDALTVVPATHDWFERGLTLYCDRPDKEWSLTDCISFQVMREHQITESLTGDHHFTQAGFVALFAT